MSEDKQVKTEDNKEKAVAEVVAKSVYGDSKKVGQGGQGGQRGQGKRNFKGGKNQNSDDMDQRILEISRVTRVMAGGKRMNFRACVAVGDKKKNRIGVGVGKGADVTIAINKAVNKAKKELITVPIVNDTIPHEVYEKTGAARIIFKPAKKGRGVIAGGVARVILELAGVKNITSKLLGSNNKINNARCTIKALASLHVVERAAKPEKKAEKIEEKKEINTK